MLADLTRDYLYVLARWAGERTAPDAASFVTGSGRPVLVLPGIYEDWRFMLPIVQRLHGRGHPVHVLPELGRNRDTIPSGADAAARYVLAADLRDVVIVAHSKGGLIGKQLMVATEASERIAHMVAVNTPFAGSRLARYALRRELREFSPRDQLLRRFATIVDVNERITSVFSSLDQVVPDGSLLPGAENIRLQFLGHFRLLGDERLLAVIDRVVERD